MARIYRKNNLLVIEGSKPVPVDGYSYSSDNGIITIINEGDGKGDFNADWSVIKDKNGNGFADSQELTNYLDTVFEYSENTDKEFRFEQPTPLSIWSITHNMGKRPTVDVFDSAGTNLIGSVSHNNNNTLTITFAIPVLGTAFLN